MPRIRHFAPALLAIFCLLAASARAQTPSVSTVNVTPGAGHVRVAAAGDVLDMRVTVSDEAGDIVFESGPFSGDKLDWAMNGTAGERVQPGTYTLTVSYRTSAGKLRRRVEQVFVTEAVTGGAEGQASSSQATAAVGAISGQGTANRVAKFTGANAIGDSAITESAGKVGIGTAAPAQSVHVLGSVSRLRLQSTNGPALTTTEYVTNGRVWQSGAGGSAAAGGVASKFFVFDQTAGQYRLVIDAAGNFGVGTAAPSSKLTVNGGIQILGAGNGIRFPDGTIQTTKAVSGSSLAGAGTAGSLVKFTGASSLSDSVIKESGGNVGIGTAAPAQKLHLSGVNSRVRLQSTSPDEWTTTEYVTNNRAWHTGVGGSHVTNGVGGKFYIYDETAQQFRMVINTSGKVGIGTTTPTAKLSVVNDDVGVGIAVSGSSSTDDVGVVGVGNSNRGVYGESNGSEGVYGTSTSADGVRGYSHKGDGVSGYSTYGYGVHGASPPGGYAGYFDGHVKVTNELKVVNGCTGCSSPSDRNLKANFSAVNPRFILDRLAALPIQTWNYKSEPESVRHIGPMAQDFRAAFQLGTDDRTLNTVDAQGVTMAAIQALYRQNQELTRSVGQLRSEVTKLRRAVNRRRGRRR